MAQKCKTKAQVSTEMRDLARLVGGRVVFNRAVIMARAWKVAQREHAADSCAGDYRSGNSLLDWFRDCLKQVWAEAKAIAFRLKPAPLPRDVALRIKVMVGEAKQRPTAHDAEELAAARAELATLTAAA